MKFYPIKNKLHVLDLWFVSLKQSGESTLENFSKY